MSLELAAPLTLEFDAIQQIIPQRFPFVMLDLVVELEPGVRAVGIKNLSGNEWFYQGHFPIRAVTPGAMLCEAAAQTGIVLFHVTRPPSPGAVVTYLLGRIAMRFLSPVLPGDQLRITVTPATVLERTALLQAELAVDGKTVAKGELALSAKPNEPE